MPDPEGEPRAVVQAHYTDVQQLAAHGAHLDAQRAAALEPAPVEEPVEFIGAGGFTPSPGVPSGILYQD